MIVKIHKLYGGTLVMKCSNYELSRMVDELRLFDENGDIIACFFTSNIAGYEVMKIEEV